MSTTTIPVAQPGGSLFHGTVTTGAGTAAVALGSAADYPGGLVVQNQDGAATLFLGGAGIDASSGGLRLAAGGSIALPSLGDPSKVYCYSASAVVVGWVGVR